MKGWILTPSSQNQKASVGLVSCMCRDVSDAHTCFKQVFLGTPALLRALNMTPRLAGEKLRVNWTADSAL